MSNRIGVELSADADVIYHPLNGFVHADAPTRWTREIVAARVVEACIVISATTPPERSPGNGWPSIVRDFQDMIGRGDEARSEVWDRWARSRPSYDADTMSRAEEAAGWPLRYLSGQDGAARVLMAWATRKAYGKPFAPVAKRKGWAMATVKRKRTAALDAITGGVSTSRVPIREAKIFP